MYAKVIVDITHEKLDKVFEYSIPEELEGVLKVGTEVLVPFGRGNREMRGYIVGFSETPDYAPDQIKEILRYEEDKRAIESKLVALAAWMKEYYGGTMIQALKTVLPIKKIKKTIKKKRIRLLLTKEEGKEKMDFYLNKNQKARARALKGLLEQPEQDYELLTKKLSISSSVIRALKEQKVLEITEEQSFRNPVKYQKKEQKEIFFTLEQQRAVDTFKRDYDSRQFRTNYT